MADGEEPPTTEMAEGGGGEEDTSAAAMFACMVPPASVMGQIEAKVTIETSSLDAFIVQLLDGLRKLASVSIIDKCLERT
jgi:hypothetical protein